MCGLVAVINKLSYGLTKEQVDIFDSLLFLDQLRGMDSTGVAMVEKNGSLYMAKEASNATEFRTKPEYKELLKHAFRTGSALFGHNRAATKGSITDENAHPFVVDDRITLMHNGTLWGDHKKLANTEVDSHAIAHVLHNKGDDVEAALQEVSGAYALIWHDFKNQTLNIIRNSQRPLHWIETSNAWIYASEANMLEWIIAKYNLKDTKGVRLLPEGTLVTYTLVKEKMEVSTKEIKLTKAVKSTGYSPGWYQESYGDSCGMDNVTVLNRSNSRGNIGRSRELEEEIADKYMCHNTYNEFNSLTYKVRPSTHHTIIFSDYIEAGTGLGWWMYGTFQAYPEVLAKVYMPAATTEVEVLAMCANEKKVMAEVTEFKWETYNKQPRNHSMMDGYIIAKLGSFTEVEEITQDA